MTIVYAIRNEGIGYLTYAYLIITVETMLISSCWAGRGKPPDPTRKFKQ